MASSEDARWLAAAARLAERARPLSRPNPAVGAILVSEGTVIGRGWTLPGGRPHAEAVALQQAGDAALGATIYVTLEPCAHTSSRGSACTSLLIAAKPARAVIGVEDPDPRTAGSGIAALRAIGIETTLANDRACRTSLAGYLTRAERGRPHITLKLAVSQDGFIARGDGKPIPITGADARAHVHRERARADAILVGGGTLRGDAPGLDVRLPGLEHRSPERWVLTRGPAPDGWRAISSPQAVSEMAGVQYLYVEGGAQTAEAFISEGLVDRLMIYRAPKALGGGLPALGGLGAATRKLLSGLWPLSDSRELGSDILEVYEPSSSEGA